MLIYENNNKLNINFDNEVSENPDLQISKEDGKTEVLIDGQPVGGGSVLVIDDTNEEIGLTIANPLMPETLMNVPGIMVDTEIDVGTLIVEAHHEYNNPFTDYNVSQWRYALTSGVDPSRVATSRYTFTGSRIVWFFGDDNKVIVPPSLAKDLVRGTKDEDIE